MAEDTVDTPEDNAEAQPSPVRFFQFPPALGVPNASPFCVKLECWMRMAEVPYETKIMADPRKAPLGKLPMIELDGKKIADSTCAIEALEKHFNKPLDKALNTAERGRALALMRMLEEHSYWALIYFRWLDDEGWPATRDTFFAGLNPLLRNFAANAVRRKTRRDANGHGLGRHSRDQIMHRFNEDMNALAACLGEKPYFGGYQPARIDASAYGVLCNVLHASQHLPLTDIARQHPNLIAHTDRMRDNYFAEYR